MKFDLVNLKSDSCLFASKNCNLSGLKPMLLCGIYVDDGLIISNSEQLQSNSIKQLESKFEVTVNNVSNFVGLEVQLDITKHEIFIHQREYICRVIERFEMQNCHEMTVPMEETMCYSKKGDREIESKKISVPYQEAIGSLLYASSGWRLNICYAINIL